MLFVSLAGMVFELVACTALGVLIWWRKSAILLPLMICLPLSLLNIGGYLLMGSLSEGSDVILMTEAGLPSAIITLAGIATMLSLVYSV